MKPLRVIVAAIVLAVAASAQDAGGCPHQRARRVAASSQLGAAVQCSGGISVNVGGVEVKTNQNQCPLFVIITPTHDVVDPTPNETKVLFIRTIPEVVAFFDCVQDWFLFIPVGSSCVLNRTANIGSVDQWQTVNC